MTQDEAIDQAIDIACSLIKKGVSLRSVAAKLGMLQADFEAFIAARPHLLLKLELAHAENEIELVERREQIYHDPALPLQAKAKLVTDQLKTRPEHAPAPSLHVQRNRTEIQVDSASPIPVLAYEPIEDPKMLQEIKERVNKLNAKD